MTAVAAGTQTNDQSLTVGVLARRGREAARHVAALTRAEKDAALGAIATALREHAEAVVIANAADRERGVQDGMTPALIDRLTLTPERIEAIAAAVEAIAALPDPVGEVVRGSTLANGLHIRQVRVPMGLVAMIYEARPNVTVDAAALALKSGNAVILRGGSAAESTNTELVSIIRNSLESQGISPDAVGLLGGGREVVGDLLTARGLVDLVIPRGGAGLIKAVVEGATVPVIETGVGNCHVFVDRSADLDKARAIVVNAKTHRPSVCNAAETLLVHEALVDEVLPDLLTDLSSAGVTVHTDADATRIAQAHGIRHVEATASDWDTEYLSLDMAVAVVPDLDAALAHIREHGTGHTEAIVTEDRAAARAFTNAVDAAAVMVNASTRFTDGGEFGFGAEIGISTQKMHARGPMGLAELTTTKWIVDGDGHIR